MRILHTISQLPAKTGSGIYTQNLIKNLNKNHTQGIFYAKQGDFKFANEFAIKEYSISFKGEDFSEAIYGMSDTMPYESSKFSSLEGPLLENYKRVFRNKIRQVIEEFKPDIILSNHLWILTSIVVEEAKGAKVIGICHGTDIRQAVKNPGLLEDIKASLQKLSHVVSLSKIQLEEIEKLYGIDEKKIEVLGGGFDQEIFYPENKEINKDKITFVYAGKFDRSKGIYELVDAIKGIDHNTCSFEIIGAKSKEEVESLENYLGHRDNVKIYQAMDQRLLADHFRANHVFILPSYFEALGLVAIEALASGMDLIISEIEGLIELIGGDLVESPIISIVKKPELINLDQVREEDKEKYVLDLRKAIEKKILSYNLKDNEKYRNKIREFSWEGIVERLEKLF